MSENNYAVDVEFLARHTEIIELTADAGHLVVVPAYQGRVMTSTASDGEGLSFGWMNREFIAAGTQDVHFNNYGGEDRFWLGPEAGQFALWFQKGEPFDLDHWKTPTEFGAGSFQVTASDAQSISMAAQFEVTNFSGTTFGCGIKRTISALNRKQAAELLGASISDELAMVGFESSNSLTNASQNDWTSDGGLVSIWTLGQFNARPGGWAIIPFASGDEDTLGPAPTTNYFGELPPERYKFTDGHLLFSCDGQCRSKIGISPKRARSLCGSYDPSAGVVTIVQFTLPADAPSLPYVNSRWEIQADPFAGDTVNAYSDGPGSGHETQANPFYELETSSPAAELKANQSITHCHRTFHFSGEFDALNELARGVLDFDLHEIA